MNMSNSAIVDLPILINKLFVGLISSQGSGPRELGIGNNTNTTIGVYMNISNIGHDLGFVILCL